jgi:hypothetical protein
MTLSFFLAGKLGQARRRQFGARRKIGLRRGPREFVARADRETIVTAIDPISDQRAQLDGDPHSLVLDRQIRDAEEKFRFERRLSAEGSRIRTNGPP